MNQDQFKGKTAIVTGAGSGIGRDLVHKLTSLGTHVIAVSQTQEKLDTLKEELGDGIEIVCLDLADWEETEEKMTPHCGHVDYLVNNAGYSHCCPLEDIPKDKTDRTFDINVKCPVNLIKLVAPGMKKRKTGSIVNVSSVASLAAVDDHATYAASKAALDMVTKCSAIELAPFNVRVNSVNPTVVWTKMGQRHWSDPAKKATILGKIPMGRFVEIHEVIEPILFLLGNESSMITGTVMPIDGGYSAT